MCKGDRRPETQGTADPEAVARAMLAELCKADDDGWFNPYIDGEGVLRCNYADDDHVEPPSSLAAVSIDGRVDLIALAKAAIAAVEGRDG